MARLGAELGCTLDLDAATYPELRVEFLAMTAAAQRDSGRSRADIVKRCAGRPGKQTVYNYAGAPDYLSFPKPELLQRYLVHCGLAPELVRFAVERCAEIRRRHPEAGKPGPRKQQPSPPESLGHHAPGRSASATTQISGSPEYGRPEGAGLGTPDRPGLWHGLARSCTPRTGFAAVGQQFITLLSPAVYEPFPAEEWQPGRRATDVSLPDRSGRCVGSAVRDSGVRISPGRMALQMVRAELESGVRHDDPTAAASLVRRAYAAGGIALHTRAGEQAEAGVPVPLNQAESGDILIRHDGGLALYAGNGTALLLGTGNPNPQPVQPDQIRTTRRITWPSVPLQQRPDLPSGARPDSNRQLPDRPLRPVSIASDPADVAPCAADGAPSAGVGALCPSAGALCRADVASCAADGALCRADVASCAADSVPYPGAGVPCPADVASSDADVAPPHPVDPSEPGDVQPDSRSSAPASQCQWSAEEPVGRWPVEAPKGSWLAEGLIGRWSAVVPVGRWSPERPTGPQSTEPPERPGTAEEPEGPWSTERPKRRWSTDGPEGPRSTEQPRGSRPTEPPEESWTAEELERPWMAEGLEGSWRSDVSKGSSSAVQLEGWKSADEREGRWSTERLEGSRSNEETLSSGSAEEPAGSGLVGEPEGPRSTEQVVAAYERAMGAASRLVEVAGRAAVPGLAALRAVDRLVFPCEEAQARLVRAAFEAIDLPLPAEIRFELPVMAVALRHLAVRPGDIVFTESGLLGIYGECGELVHLGPAGTRAVTDLHPAVYAAAWRVSAVPARTGYGLVSAVTMVEHDGTGRLVRIDRLGERRSGRHNRSPETAEVVAMVIEVVEQVTRRGVVLPLSSRELFAAANFRGGVEFSPMTAAWDPRREPVYPLDASLPTAPDQAPASPATAAQLFLARSGSAQLARWVRRPRPGVA